MGAALPVNLLDVGQSEVGFMNQCRWLERMVGGLTSQMNRGNSTQFFVDQWDKTPFGLPVAPLQFEQEIRHLSGCRAHKNPLKREKIADMPSFIPLNAQKILNF
jgi:hypothetical protein